MAPRRYRAFRVACKQKAWARYPAQATPSCPIVRLGARQPSSSGGSVYHFYKRQTKKLASRSHAFSGEEKAWYNAILQFVPFAAYSANFQNARDVINQDASCLDCIPFSLAVIPFHGSPLGFETLETSQAREVVCVRGIARNL